MINYHTTFRKVHFYCTMLLILAVTYIVTFELILASKSWWVIISISGYSTFIVIFLTSLYLFSIFRGVSRIEKNPDEHPLTTSLVYLFFYDSSPVLGILAGIIAAYGAKSTGNFLFITAVGILWATITVWIVVDPAIGFVEILLPGVATRRKERLRQLKLLKQEQEELREQLFNKIELEEEKENLEHYNVLRPLAERLIFLLSSNNNSAATEAVDIGVKAWQLGGINSMKQVYSIIMDIYKKRCLNIPAIDQISSWWDGIGSWRTDYFKEYNLIQERKS